MLRLARARDRRHRDEREEDDHEARGVDDEQPRDADREVQETGGERTDDLRAVEGRGLKTDGARDRARRDEAREHRVAARCIERERRGLHRRRDEHVPQRDRPEHGDEREERRVDRHDALRHEEQTAPIAAVGDGARDEREPEAGDRAREAGQAEIQRSELRGAVTRGELDDEDPEGEDLHPRARAGGGEADPEQAEVAVSQGVKQVDPPK